MELRSGKPFYLTLEGLRGIAAALVLSRHAGSSVAHLLFHSYLAVDLFFVLSGFVLGATYDRDLADRSLAAGAFIKKRVIRLYPLFLLATFVAFAASLLAISYWNPRLTGYVAWLQGSPLSTTTAAFLFSLLMLPSVFSSALYPLNGAAWSLFYELIVNFIYAAARPFVSLRTAKCAVALCGCGIVLCALSPCGVDGGMFWGDFSAGILRAGYSFGAGLLLVGARRQTKSSNLGSTGLLFFAGCLLVMPSWGAFNPFYDMAVVLVFFPAVVFAASQVQPTGRWVALFAALGKSSYGIYILQVPVSALVAIGFTEIFHAKIGSGAPLVLLPCLFAAALALDKAYDRPLRRLLGRLKFF